MYQGGGVDPSWEQWSGGPSPWHPAHPSTILSPMKPDPKDTPRRRSIPRWLNDLTSNRRAAVAVLGHILIVTFWLWAGIQIGQLLWQVWG